MPVLPWRRITEVDAQRRYTALLGYVAVPTVSLLPRFAWYGFLIERQLQRSAGLVGYKLAVEFLTRKFYHLSVWEEPADIHRFVHEQPHRRIMEALAGRIGKTVFRYWTVPGSELPLDFKREWHRLDDDEAGSGCGAQGT